MKGLLPLDLLSRVHSLAKGENMSESLTKALMEWSSINDPRKSVSSMSKKK